MHIPVLQQETIEYLAPKPNENFVDATVGQAGHALAILERIKPDGKVLGIDRDQTIIKRLTYDVSHLKLVLVCGNFSDLEKIVEEHKFGPIQGILFDLGMSSWHLEQSGRGFTFQKDEPLNMRYQHEEGMTAEEILNDWSVQGIEKILREYGEERFSQRIAKAIIEARRTKPIKSTFQLKEIIEKVVPGRSKIHPATRTFQALRIAVNDELTNIKRGLEAGFKVLEPNGRIVVISFHSLEDRITKNFFKEKAQEDKAEILTKKPIIAQEAEIKENPRARSAKLRTITKLHENHI